MQNITGWFIIYDSTDALKTSKYLTFIINHLVDAVILSQGCSNFLSAEPLWHKLFTESTPWYFN